MARRAAALASALALAACGGARGAADAGAEGTSPRPPSAPPVAAEPAPSSLTARPESASPAPTPTENRPMSQPANASLSPTGDPHPGAIVHDDKVDGRTWTRAAAEVPPSIGWVKVGEAWRAVVRIEISGTAAQRRFTKFADDGTMLESTIQAPAPPPPQPQPTPTPTPTPTL